MNHVSLCRRLRQPRSALGVIVATLTVIALLPRVAFGAHPPVQVPPVVEGVVEVAQQCDSLSLTDFGNLAGGTARIMSMERRLAGAYAVLGVQDEATSRPESIPWIRQFCGDLASAPGSPPFEAGAPSPDRLLVGELISEIGALAHAMDVHGDWSAMVRSGRFRDWFSVRFDGTLSPRVLAGPAAALYINPFLTHELSGAFRLTSGDLDSLSMPGSSPSYALDSVTVGLVVAQLPDTLGALRDQVRALQPMRFPSEDSAYAVIDLVFPVPVPVQISATSSAPPTVRDGALRGRRPAPSTTSVLPAIAPFVERIRAGLRVEAVDPLPEDRGPPISAQALLGLRTLTDKWFPDGQLFKTAVRMTSGIGEHSPDALARIMEIARGGVMDTLPIQPLRWDGGPCGCGVFERGAVEEPEFYGMQGFWEAPQGLEESSSEQDIDFSLLTRVGYYGVTFDDQGNLQDPLHFKTGRYPERAWPRRGRKFAQFVDKAHQFKVKADLVVYNSDWDVWLRDGDGDPSESARARMQRNFGTLIEDLIGHISTPLSNFLDRTKPVITLGQSPRRTLGDGVTLDFDFEGVPRQQQERLFDLMADSVGFFRALDDALDIADGNDDAFLFHLDLDYRLNLLVPAYCIATSGGLLGNDNEGCGFYSVENLLRIADHIDLFLIDMTAQSDSRDVDGSNESLLGRVRALRDGVEGLAAADQSRLVHKLIPLVVPQASDELNDFLTISELSFRGVGAWSITSVDDFNASLKDVFLPTPPLPDDLPMVARWISHHSLALLRYTERRLCAVMCPSRWWVRLAMFSSVVGLVVFWLWTESAYELKRWYGTRRFALFVVSVVLLTTGTLWCDPYWNQHQGLIITVLAFGSLVVFLAVRARLGRERYYP